MQKNRGMYGLARAVLLTALLAAVASGTASASAAVGAVTRTFSFIGKPSSKTATLVNIDSLLINARCDSKGRPVVFAFSSASSADIFGRIFDGFGRVHVVKNSSFDRKARGVQLSTTSGDFDASGTVLFETSAGKVVTVDLAFDNSVTLGKQHVCTVYGSAVAS